jgi:hypothetical protein
MKILDERLAVEVDISGVPLRVRFVSLTYLASAIGTYATCPPKSSTRQPFSKILLMTPEVIISPWYSSKEAGVANLESTSDFFNVSLTRLFSGSMAKT